MYSNWHKDEFVLKCSTRKSSRRTSRERWVSPIGKRRVCADRPWTADLLPLMSFMINKEFENHGYLNSKAKKWEVDKASV